MATTFTTNARQIPLVTTSLSCPILQALQSISPTLARFVRSYPTQISITKFNVLLSVRNATNSSRSIETGIEVTGTILTRVTTSFNANQVKDISMTWSGDSSLSNVTTASYYIFSQNVSGFQINMRSGEFYFKIKNLPWPATGDIIKGTTDVFPLYTWASPNTGILMGGSNSPWLYFNADSANSSTGNHGVKKTNTVGAKIVIGDLNEMKEVFINLPM